MKKLLITGGAGFIGVNAAAHFVRTGWQVTVFDNLSRRGTDVNLEFLATQCGDKCTVERGDVRTDTDRLSVLASQHDACLHLAAQVAVTTSVTDPRTDFDCNALGTFNVLEAARSAPNKPAVLYASTNKVYGGLDNLDVLEKEDRCVFADGRTGVSEDQQLDFHSPYGCSKGAADQYVRDYARIYDLKTVVFRQSCIYGQHQLGVEDQGWVAWFLIAALLGKKITVYGTGRQVRDLLHIDDLVALYDRALQNIDAVSGQVFNVGGGHANSLSLLEFIAIIEQDLKLSLPFGRADWRPGDQPIFVSDNTKAKKLLAWEPKVHVRDGIRLLLTWLREHEHVLRKLYG